MLWERVAVKVDTEVSGMFCVCLRDWSVWGGEAFGLYGQLQEMWSLEPTACERIENIHFPFWDLIHPDPFASFLSPVVLGLLASCLYNLVISKLKEEAACSSETLICTFASIHSVTNQKTIILNICKHIYYFYPLIAANLGHIINCIRLI
jgi:hypothetical protein